MTDTQLLNILRISIHALRKESDPTWPFTLTDFSPYFNPRSP